MKAIEVTEYGPPEVLELRDVDKPTPTAEEVRIKVAAIGVNFADIKRRKGISRTSPEPPFIPGIEVAGTVDKAGGDTDYDHGDRVVAYLSKGGYAEYVVAHAGTVFPIPTALSFDEAAATLVQFVTAYESLHRCGGIQAGDQVLIHGAAGGVGSAAVQLAATADAVVYGTAGTADKCTFAADLGASHCINYEARDFVTEVERHTDGRGVDLVLDGVGGVTFEQSLDCIAPFGSLVSIGCVSGQEGKADPSQLRQNCLSIHGFHLGKTLRTRPDRIQSTVETIGSALLSGDVSAVVDKRLSLTAANQAHDYMEARRTHGKLLLHP